MGTNQIMAHCRKCNAQTIHLQQGTSHVLHLLLSLITFGIWVPVWALVAISNSGQKHCTQCGKLKGLFGT